MPNITITQLPAAGPLTGTESVPIVQNGQTLRTTTGAIASAPNQQQTFLTINQEPTLPNSRYLSTSVGLGITDGGAQSFYRLNLNGASGSLEAAGNGLVVKTASNAVTNRSITTSGAGLVVTDGDGVSGDPTLSLDGLPAALANIGGTGMLAVVGGTVISGRQIYGTADQIDVANGNGSNDPVISITSNPVIPGTGAMTIPVGTSAQQPVGSNGQIRYNSDTGFFEGYSSGSWNPFTSGGGVTSFSGGTTGLTPSSPAIGAIVLGGVLNPVSGGTGISSYAVGDLLFANTTTSLDRIPVGANGFLLASNGTAPTYTDPSNVTVGEATNVAGGAANEIVYNSATGTTSFITAPSVANTVLEWNGSAFAWVTPSGTVANAVTFDNSGAGGASGSTFDGSSPLTVSYNTLGASPLAGSTSINTLGTITTGVWNGTPIDNAYLTNSSLTIGSTSISLGASSSTLAGLTSVTVTQDPLTPLELATKQYVDAVAEGLHVHASCAAATTDTLAVITGGTVIYNNGAAGVGATLTLSNPLTILDGYTLQNGDRVLIKNEVAQANNGIYTWATGGTVLTRATDFDTPTEIASGDFTFISNGTLYGDTGWVQIDPVTTVGTDPINFIQFSGAGTYTAGTGLTLTGTQFSITNTGVSAASYGTASSVPTIAINAQGQITSASNTPIAISGSQVTSGSVPSSTNLAGGATNEIPYQTGSGTTSFITAPTVASTVLQWNGSAFTWGTVTTSPAGSNTQIQFNNSGSFGASANLTFDGTTLVATNITDSSLTSGRVVYATTGGNLTDSANLLYSGTDLTVYGLTFGRGAGAQVTNSAVGNGALASNSTGSGVVAVGYQALYQNTTQGNITAAGYQAMYNMRGGNNTALGNQAMYGSGTPANNIGDLNIAVGNSSLFSLTSGQGNTAVGYQAAYSLTSNSNNVAVGTQSLYNSISNSQNTAVGYQSQYNIRGGDNTALGFRSMYGSGTPASNTGASNVGIGYDAMYSQTSASFNVGVGREALYANTTGSNQTAIGYQAMYYMRGASNTAAGNQAMFGSTTPANNTGTNNAAYGQETLRALTSGSSNTATGYRAGFNLTSGSSNAFVGREAGSGVSTTSFQVGIGAFALRGATAAGITAVGYQALGESTYGKGSDHVAVGNQAGYFVFNGARNVYVGSFSGYNDYYSNDAVKIGYNCGYSSYYATGSVLIGRNAGYNASNYDVAIGVYTLNGGTSGATGYNTAVGSYVLNANSSGYYNAGLGAQALYTNTTGAGNTSVGYQTLYNNTTTSNQTAVGYQSMYNMRGGSNTALGNQAMYGSGTPANNTGSGNTAIGKSSLFSLSSGINNTALGQGAGLQITTGSNNTIIGSYNGNQGGLDIRTASDYIVLSDGNGNPRAYWNGANATFGGSAAITGGIGGGTF